MTTLICSCGDLASVPMIDNEMIWARCLPGCLIPLVSNTKVNLSQPLPPQLVCNQGNHSVVKTTNQFFKVCGQQASSLPPVIPVLYSSKYCKLLLVNRIHILQLHFDRELCHVIQ